LLAEYEKAPDVTRQRLYLETLADVLPRLGGKVILDADARQVLPLFPLPGLTPGALPPGGAPAESPERADGPAPDRIPALRRRGSE
jgi:membrane protease subunit HflK